MADKLGSRTNTVELPASVLEPLQAKKSAPSTNPFEAYDARDIAQQNVQTEAACTAFASVCDNTSGGGSVQNVASIVYPEGLPKFMGLLRPTITFGIGYSTLSRGMTFTAHFVAVTTWIIYFGVLLAVSWMQKVCMPIARHWDFNYTIGFGVFSALLGEFRGKNLRGWLAWPG